MLSPLTFVPQTIELDSGRAAGPAPIYVVDDDAVAQVLVGQALSRAGLVNPVVALFDGEQAIRELRRVAALGASHLPGLVVLACELPAFDGIEVLRWMRSSAGLVRVPVVMLSADSIAQNVTQAYALGASSYLVKPLAFSTLGSVVRNLALPWQIV